MEENKSNKGLICLIVILIILILGLVGYIVYDKVLKVDKVIPNYDKNSVTITTTTTTTTTLNSQEKFDIELKDLKFPNENDNNVLVYGNVNDFIDSNTKKMLDIFENYKNVTYNINGFNFEESCTDYSSVEPSNCRNSQMIINGKIKINFALDIPYSERKFMLITDKNIIVQKGIGAITLGAIEIYDYQGNLIKTIETTTSYLIYRGDGCEVLYDGNRTYDIRVVDNKLHYIDAGIGAIYKTFDLETYDENIVGTINASTSQQC